MFIKTKIYLVDRSNEEMGVKGDVSTDDCQINLNEIIAFYPDTDVDTKVFLRSGHEFIIATPYNEVSKLIETLERKNVMFN